MNGCTENLSGMSSLGKILDLLTGEKEQVRDTARQVRFNHLIPMVGENVVKQAFSQYENCLFNPLDPLAPTAP